MKRSVTKRSLIIAGHKTSISVEDPFWKALQDIAAAKGITVSELVAHIDRDRQQRNLSSHIRLFVLAYYQSQVAALGATDQTVSSPTSPTR